MSLSFEERRLLRAAVSVARRVQLVELRALAGTPACSRCGMPQEDWTPGCVGCWDRWRGYFRRGKIGEREYLWRRQVAVVAGEGLAAEVWSENGRKWGRKAA